MKIDLGVTAINEACILCENMLSPVVGITKALGVCENTSGYSVKL